MPHAPDLAELTRSRTREALAEQTAYTRGLRDGATSVIEELQRAGAFTSTRGRRLAERLLAQNQERRDG